MYKETHSEEFRFSQWYASDAPGRAQGSRACPAGWNAITGNRSDGCQRAGDCYGGNIGAVRRSVYPAKGGRKPFVSGYTNAWVPNLWDRSKGDRAA